MTGPFIVTHRRPVDAVDCGHPEAPKDGWVLYREAFATLEEAWEPFRAALIAQRTHGGVLPPRSQYREGGQFTLPDGSVSEVEATTYERISGDCGLLAVRGSGEPGWSDARFLAAWNAEHGIGIRREARS